MNELPPIILLSGAVIDREARLIIERDENDPNKVWIDNGGPTKYFYVDDDARKILDFYYGQGDWR